MQNPRSLIKEISCRIYQRKRQLTAPDVLNCLFSCLSCLHCPQHYINSIVNINIPWKFTKHRKDLREHNHQNSCYYGYKRFSSKVQEEKAWLESFFQKKKPAVYSREFDSYKRPVMFFNLSSTSPEVEHSKTSSTSFCLSPPSNCMPAKT